MLDYKDVRERMVRVGVTQWRLAVESGVSPGTVQRFLAGRLPGVRAETLDRIERAMAELERQYDESL